MTLLAVLFQQAFLTEVCVSVTLGNMYVHVCLLMRFKVWLTVGKVSKQMFRCVLDLLQAVC